MMRRIIITGLLAATVVAAAVTASSASAMHRTSSSPATNSKLVADLALARVATAKYVNNDRLDAFWLR
jgi:hypothetical protein